LIRCAGCGRGCRLTGGRRGATRSGVGGGPDDGSDGEPGESLDDRTSPCEPAAASARAGVGTACEAGLWEGLTKRKPAKGPSCAETALAGVARGDCAWGLRSAESTSRTGVAGRSGPGGRLRRVGLALLGALASAARSLGSRDDASPRRCVLGAGHGVCWELSPAGSTEAKSSEPSSSPAQRAGCRRLLLHPGHGHTPPLHLGHCHLASGSRASCGLCFSHLRMHRVHHACRRPVLVPQHTTVSSSPLR